MRRRSFPLVVLAFVALGLGAPWIPSLAAQLGTPAAVPSAEHEMPPGVTSVFIATGPVSELPPTPAFMVIIRLTLEPGAVLPADPSDPAGAFIVVEAGTATVRLGETATAELTLGPGGSLYGPPFTPGEIRNDGQEPLVLLLAIVGPDGEEGSAEATPAA